MPDLVELVAALSETKQPVRLGLTDLPDGPGIYGLYGDAEAWAQLGFGEPGSDGLLYLGLTVDGLHRRVIKTHFAAGKTPWSIVRRSIASVLRVELGLEAQERSSDVHRHFGLSSKGDRALSKWMRAHIEVGFFHSESLDELIELAGEAIQTWEPTLSPYYGPAAIRERVEAARVIMAGPSSVGAGAELDSQPASRPRPEPGLETESESQPESVGGGPLALIGDLLAALDGGDPVLSLAQGKPTWLIDFNQDKILVETESAKGGQRSAHSIPMGQFVSAYETLSTNGSLVSGDLSGAAKRRSAFVLAALARLDGVEVERKPLRIVIPVG